MFRAMDSSPQTLEQARVSARVDPTSFSPALASRRQMQRGLLRRFMRQQGLKAFVLLAGAEVALLALTPWLAERTLLQSAVQMPETALAPTVLTSLVFAGISWLTMITLGLYQRHSQETEGVAGALLTRLSLSIAAGTLALLLLDWLAPGQQTEPALLGLTAAIALLLLLVSRLAFLQLSGGDALKRRVLLIGAENSARASIADTLKQNHCSRVVFVDLAPLERFGGGSSPTAVNKLSLAQSPALPSRSLVDLAFKHQVDDIVVATNDLRNCLSMDELMSCRLAGISVFRLDAFYERELGRVMLESLLPSWFVFTSHFDRSVVRRFSKRAFDLVTAGMVLALAWPMMLLVALAIWLECGGRESVLYQQERVGEGDSVFKLYKFRSMRSDAESDGVARWASADDNRVTRIGRIVRKLRLDELPQLYNVFRGDMSMVGPRPERPEIVAQLKHQIPFYGLRHSVVPGLTGWAQLRYPYGASVKDAEEKLRYDLYYIKEQSMLFDLEILMQTVEVVLFRRGSR